MRAYPKRIGERKRKMHLLDLVGIIAVTLLVMSPKYLGNLTAKVTKRNESAVPSIEAADELNKKEEEE